MAAGMINELYELVVSICDQLYAGRQLVTTTSVKKLVLLHDSWSEEDLELQLPTYVNQWRLQNLKQSAPTTAVHNTVMHLEDRVKRYRAGLLDLKREIRGMLNE